MGCNSIINLQSETFCDGTYVGPGGSFDISSNHHIVIKSSSKISLDTVSGGGTSDINLISGGDIALTCPTKTVSLGDTAGTGNITKISLSDGSGIISLIANGTIFELNDGSGEINQTATIINLRANNTSGAINMNANSVITTCLEYQVNPTNSFAVRDAGLISMIATGNITAEADIIDLSAGTTMNLTGSTVSIKNKIKGDGIINVGNAVDTNIIALEGKDISLTATQTIMLPGLSYAIPSNTTMLYYETPSGQITQGPAPSTPLPAVRAIGTYNGDYILTAGIDHYTLILMDNLGTLNFTTSDLSSNNVEEGFAIFVRNGTKRTPSLGVPVDVSITIDGGSPPITIPKATATTSGGSVILYWTGVPKQLIIYE